MGPGDGGIRGYVLSGWGSVESGEGESPIH